MKHNINGLTFLLIFNFVFTCAVQAETTKKQHKWVPKAADSAPVPKTEQEKQLLNAKKAASERLSREQEILKLQLKPDWEQQQQQKQKIKKQFSERQRREQAQLEAAKKSAKQTKKIQKDD